MTAKISALRRPGERVPKEVLLELGQNPNLEAFQIVCHWKADENNPTGYTTVGWTSNMSNSEMIFGARHMMLAADAAGLGDD